MKLYDTVTLIEDIPTIGLYRGQVGTLVEQYAPETFEVEFSDLHGRTYALATLKESQLLVLHHELADSPCKLLDAV